MEKLFYRNTKLPVLSILSLVILLAVSGCSFQYPGSSAPRQEVRATSTPAQPELNRPAVVTSPQQARELLVQGNIRFMKNKLAVKDLGDTRRQTLTAGQKPFAVIVGCSDSRVPPELAFDQGLGDLFVVRVAGNVVDPDVLGSVEYAVEHLDAPLVVVMGHEKCGAVKAAVEGGEAPGSIGALIEKIKPSVDKARAQGNAGEELVEISVDENVRSMVTALQSSPILTEAVNDGKLAIVGTKYYLGAGQVVWFP